MDFDVYTDLKDRKGQYNVKIGLENEVDSHARELAIVLSGTIIRNYHKNLYEGISNDEQLSAFIKTKLNLWIPKESEFVATSVITNPKQVKNRG